MPFGPRSSLDFYKLMLQQQKLGLAAGEVVARRLAAMMTGGMSRREAVTMVTEKPKAVSKGAEAAAAALASGKGPLAATRAFYEPMTKRARANAKRLRK